MTRRHDVLTVARRGGALSHAGPSRRGWFSSAGRARIPTIAVFGLFGCGNLGNDGSLQTMLDVLREARPGSEVFCICHDPALVARSHAVATVPISWSRHVEGGFRRFDRLLMKVPGKLVDLVQTVRHARKAAVMVVPGTGILDDFGERPRGMPFSILCWCLAARLAGARIAFVSIGAGPIRNPLSRWLMKSAARLAHYRSYRDEMSRAYMLGIGFDASTDRVFPDIVFRLRTPTIRRREANGTLTIGVGVMSYYGWYAYADGADEIFATYIAKMAQFVIHLLEAGHDVRLLTGEIADWTAVDALMTAIAKSRPLPEPGRLVAMPAYSLTQVMEQIVETDVVVATRFHNIVCALKVGRPTISLGYSRKNDVLMEEMGLAAFCQHVEQFDVAILIGQLDRLIADREKLAEDVGVRTREFEERLVDQEAILAKTVFSRT